MKKAIVFIAAFSLFVSSCIGYGAASAGSFGGALLGGAIGGILGGPRGHDIGTVIGSLGGFAAGASVEMNRQKRMAENQNRAEQPQRSELSVNKREGAPRRQTRDVLPEEVVYTPISIRNLQLIDDNGDNSFNRDETCTLTFELRNNAPEKLENIQLQLVELTNNKHLVFSTLPLIESMNPRQLLRITTYIKADNRLKDGTAAFAVSASINGEDPVDLIEFTAPTKK